MEDKSFYNLNQWNLEDFLAKQKYSIGLALIYRGTWHGPRPLLSRTTANPHLEINPKIFRINSCHVKMSLWYARIKPFIFDVSKEEEEEEEEWFLSAFRDKGGAFR